jgi:hypothetical protein
MATVTCHVFLLDQSLLCVSSVILPSAFIEETLQTLQLLFPKDDLDTKKWFAKLNKTARPPLDRNVVKIGTLCAEAKDFEKFHFWYDRLVTLKQVYNEARSEIISQWWHDRLHPSEWYAVCTAVLVIVLTCVFGLAQCVLAAMQVYPALKDTPGLV